MRCASSPHADSGISAATADCRPRHPPALLCVKFKIGEERPPDLVVPHPPHLYKGDSFSRLAQVKDLSSFSHSTLYSVQKLQLSLTLSTSPALQPLHLYLVEGTITFCSNYGNSLLTHLPACSFFEMHPLPHAAQYSSFPSLFCFSWSTRHHLTCGIRCLLILFSACACLSRT